MLILPLPFDVLPLQKMCTLSGLYLFFLRGCNKEITNVMSREKSPSPYFHTLRIVPRRGGTAALAMNTKQMPAVQTIK